VETETPAALATSWIVMDLRVPLIGRSSLQACMPHPDINTGIITGIIFIMIPYYEDLINRELDSYHGFHKNRVWG
jgi:hypothetical protein